MKFQKWLKKCDLDMAGPAKLKNNRRKPYCDWVMQTQTPVAVLFGAIFFKFCWPCHIQTTILSTKNHQKSLKNYWKSIFLLRFNIKRDLLKSCRLHGPLLGANMRSIFLIYVTRRAQDASGDDPRGIFFESKFDLNIQDISDQIFIDFWWNFDSPDTGKM